MTDTTPSTAEDATGPGRGSLSKTTRSALEWAAVVVGALVVALVVKTFLIQAFYIPSESMVPTLNVGDRVLVNKLSGDPDHGDVVVFARPGGPGPDGIKDLIKRVIAVEGDTVRGENGQVYVNDIAIAEDYLPLNIRTSDFAEITVPDDHLWMMGDNRSSSDDSRRFGPVPVDDVVGRAFITIWPISEIGGL